MSTPSAPLKFLTPVWFSTVMGFSGLSLAWHRASPLMGDSASGLALLFGAVAATLFVALLVASLRRLQRHPEAWADDLKHPVRHVFVAALPVAGLLLATVLTTLFGDTFSTAKADGDVLSLRGMTVGLWGLSSLGQLATTVWVCQRWWAGPKSGGLSWPVVAPGLLVPIVGNVLAPLAGVPLGFAPWAAAQFGIGLLFWPVVLALMAVRLALQGLWPDRLLPSTFILIAPPAVIGLSSLQLGAPEVVGWICWGIALFTLLWVGTLLRRMGGTPFGMAHWGASFPMAALAGLTLRLAGTQGFMSMLATLLLALTSLIFFSLTLATVRGLRDGSLLAPEPVASIQPIGTP